MDILNNVQIIYNPLDKKLYFFQIYYSVCIVKHVKYVLLDWLKRILP